MKFYNLALLDIRLPDIEGIELIRPLKQSHPDMAFIIITAYAALDNPVQTLNQGASAYITNPLDMAEALARAREVLEKQRLVMENRRLYLATLQELAERRRLEEELLNFHSNARRCLKLDRLLLIQDYPCAACSFTNLTINHVRLFRRSVIVPQPTS